MIVVVEGPSAAGKTTWLTRFDQMVVVDEIGRIEPPDRSPVDEARFWADLDAGRWKRVLDVPDVDVLIAREAR